MMSKLKLVIPWMEAETCKVKVACLICPAFRVWLSKFQLNVMYCVALDGFQFEVDIDKVTMLFPSFLM